MKGLCKNILITVITSVLLLLATEIFFRLFMVQSDGVQFTLISKEWFRRYWHPINSLGYRDIERTPDSLKGKKVIFVVGDSLVAGQGIRNYKRRFSNLLQEKLGESVAVVNIAQCGWSTEDEYQAIRRYPYDPDMIIVMYVMNDIEGAAQRVGVKSFSAGSLEPAPIIKYFVNNSYFLNYLYYRLYISFNSNRKISKSYVERLKNYHLNEIISEKHHETLINLINYAKGISAQVVFIFPQLDGPNLDFIYKLIEFIKTNRAGVIDMEEKYTRLNIDTDGLQLSKIDGHPNERANQIFADTILEYIKNNKILEAAVD